MKNKTRKVEQITSKSQPFPFHQTQTCVLTSSAPARVMAKSSLQRQSAKESCNFVLQKQTKHPKAPSDSGREGIQ